MGIENTHKLIVNCLPLNEGERRAFAKAARDVPQEFVGDETHRGDMVWSAAVPEELRSRATAVIGNFPVSQASQYTRLEWLQTFSAGVDAYICPGVLPRIGGSVLAHDHYQGGGELLPMHKAATWSAFTLAGYPDAVVEILDWPGTAVRVVSKNRQSIIDVSDIIREAWVGYDDAANGIASHDADGNRQSALSPSVIVTERGYEMSLIFRNNAISDEYPEGIFHAHPEYWPVKQEPIGLIEAQGLFILPGRLVDQLGIVEEALAEGRDLPDEVSEFSLEWGELAETLAGNRDREAIRQAIHDELGSVCYRILGNTAVFKRKATTQTFLESLGFAAR